MFSFKQSVYFNQNLKFLFPIYLKDLFLSINDTRIELGEGQRIKSGPV